MAKKQYESADMLAFVGRVLRASVRRAGKGDLAALSTLEGIRLALDQLQREAAEALRAEPWNYSWADIGRELGVTRQAAEQRLGSP